MTDRIHLALQLEAANRLGQLGNLADVADDLGLLFDADYRGRVTIVTDGSEAARVRFSEDGTRVDGFDPCAVPDWAKPTEKEDR